MTSDEHTSGTERVAEVASQPRFRGYTTIVNVQGDEPFIGSGAVKGAADLVSTGKFPLGTAASRASTEILDTPNLVKWWSLRMAGQCTSHALQFRSFGTRRMRPSSPSGHCSISECTRTRAKR